MTAKKRIKSKVDSNAVSVESTALLGLLADIRCAVGDPPGKLMQDELVEHCRKLKGQHELRGNRLDLLARVQKHMRDPERTLVCDILANGQLLPDPQGKRYGFAATGNEHHCEPNDAITCGDERSDSPSCASTGYPHSKLIPGQNPDVGGDEQ